MSRSIEPVQYSVHGVVLSYQNGQNESNRQVRAKCPERSERAYFSLP